MPNEDSPKYELLGGHPIRFFGNKLFRIISLKDFDTHDGRKVKKGDLGGYVASMQNLSQKGTCWIFGNAKAFGNSRVRDDALLCNNALAFDHAEVTGRSIVHDSAAVCKHVKLIDEEVKAGSIRNDPDT